MICLNTLPPERKKKAREHLESTWPELLDELVELRRAFGDCQVYYEVKKDVVQD